MAERIVEEQQAGADIPKGESMRTGFSVRFNPGEALTRVACFALELVLPPPDYNDRRRGWTVVGVNLSIGVGVGLGVVVGKTIFNIDSPEVTNFSLPAFLPLLGSSAHSIDSHARLQMFLTGGALTFPLMVGWRLSDYICRRIMPDQVSDQSV